MSLQSYQLKSLIDKVLHQDGKLRKGDTEATYFCPWGCKPDKRKLEVSIDGPDFGSYHCWICNTAGRSIRSLFYKLKAKESYFNDLYKIIGKEWIYSENREKRIVDLSLPDEFTPLWNPSKSFGYGYSMSYLKDRNVTMDDIIRYNIGYCDKGIYKDRVLVPSYNKDGNVNFFAGRAYHEGNSYKYMLPPWPKDIIGFELFINWNYDYVTVTEGVFDAITIKNNSIPLFGTSMSNALKERIIISGIPRVNLVLDGDEAGINGAIKIYEFLQPFDINVHFILLEEKDASVIGFEKINDIINNSSTTTFKDIIKIKLNV